MSSEKSDAKGVRRGGPTGGIAGLVSSLFFRNSGSGSGGSSPAPAPSSSSAASLSNSSSSSSSSFSGGSGGIHYRASGGGGANSASAIGGGSSSSLATSSLPSALASSSSSSSSGSSSGPSASSSSSSALSPSSSSSSAGAVAAAAPQSRRQQQLTLGSALLGGFFVSSSVNLMAPNLTLIASDFALDGSARDLILGGWMSFAFFIVGTVPGFFVGSLTDRAERKGLLLALLAAAATVIACTGCAWHLGQLLALRAALGAVVASLQPILMSLVGDLVAPAARPAMASYISLALGGGTAVGQIAAGLLAGGWGWRAPYLAAAAGCAIAWIAVYLFAVEPARGLADRGAPAAEGASGDAPGAALAPSDAAGGAGASDAAAAKEAFAAGLSEGAPTPLLAATAAAAASSSSRGGAASESDAGSTFVSAAAALAGRGRSGSTSFGSGGGGGSASGSVNVAPPQHQQPPPSASFIAPVASPSPPTSPTLALLAAGAAGGSGALAATLVPGAASMASAAAVGFGGASSSSLSAATSSSGGASSSALAADAAAAAAAADDHLSPFASASLFRRLAGVLAVPTNRIIFLQSVFGTLPWSVVTVFLPDFFVQNLRFGAAAATKLVMLFGVGAAVGGVVGGSIVGSWLYRHRGAASVPLVMGAVQMAAALPMLLLINMQQGQGGGGGDLAPSPAPAPGLGAHALAVLGGFVASQAGPNIKTMLMNANAPRTRGAVFTLATAADNLSKGAAPVVISAAIAFAGVSRAAAFSLAMLGWVVSGALIMSATRTLRADEAAARQLAAAKFVAGKPAVD